MHDTLVDWNSPGNYLLPGLIIGLILFGLLIANFIVIYFKYSKKASANIDTGKNKGKERKDEK